MESRVVSGCGDRTRMAATRKAQQKHFISKEIKEYNNKAVMFPPIHE